MKRKLLIIISLVTLVILSGCGGGSVPGATSTNTGIFIDSPVEGLKYETVTLSGYTNNKGQFQYKTGETVKFFIGNLELGNVLGQNTITPLTLNGENDLNNISATAVGLARLLQTLDNNSSNGAVLTIPNVLRDLNITELSLNADADLNTILAKAQAKTGINYILKDATSAEAEMKKYIEYFNTYKAVETKSYTGIGTNFLRFNVVNTEKLNITFNGGYASLDIYDMNLTASIYHIEGSSAFGTTSLKTLAQGNYIIKINNYYDVSSAELITVDSEYLNNINFVETKSYTGIGTNFLRFNVVNTEKLNITFNGGYASLDIYDMNLTASIYHIEGSSAFGTTSLKTLAQGNYIIKINNYYDVSSVELNILY